MDKFPPLQANEIIPELRFKCMESYQSDNIPQLKSYSIATINWAPSNDRGEQWFMTAQPF